MVCAKNFLRRHVNNQLFVLNCSSCAGSTCLLGRGITSSGFNSPSRTVNADHGYEPAEDGAALSRGEGHPLGVARAAIARID